MPCIGTVKVYKTHPDACIISPYDPLVQGFHLKLATRPVLNGRMVIFDIGWEVIPDAHYRTQFIPAQSLCTRISASYLTAGMYAGFLQIRVRNPALQK